MNLTEDGWGESDTRAQGISALRQKRESKLCESRGGGEVEVDVRGPRAHAEWHLERRPRRLERASHSPDAVSNFHSLERSKLERARPRQTHSVGQGTTPRLPHPPSGFL